MPFFVFFNGIDSKHGLADLNDAQRRVLTDQLGSAPTFVCNFMRPNDHTIKKGFLRSRAETVVANLLTSKGTNGNEAIVFVAHNVGAALAKQVLLLALEKGRTSWIAHQTVALHLIESPSFTEPSGWENFLLRLLSSGRPVKGSPASHVAALPHELASIEAQFSAIAQAFDIQHHNLPGDQVFDDASDLWNFSNDGNRLLDVLDSVRAAGRMEMSLAWPGRSELARTSCRSEAGTGQLSLASVDLRALSGLESHEAYTAWCSAPGPGLLAVTGERGLGKTHAASLVLASLVLASLRARDADRLAKEPGAAPKSEALFLSFSFNRWDTTRNTERSLVLSLIRQLLVLRPSICGRIYAAAKSAFDMRPCTCAPLWRIVRFVLALPLASEVYIVVNAVDQCQTPAGAAVAALVAAALEPQPGGLPAKILLTSSELAGSGFAALPDKPFVSRLTLEASHWKAAVRAATAEHVERLVDRRAVWRTRQDEIVQHAMLGGTYLHSVLSVGLLESPSLPSTQAALDRHLRSPAQTLDQIFDSLISHVQQSDRALLALQWIYHAVRPLSVPELAVALALSGFFFGPRAAAAPQGAEVGRHAVPKNAGPHDVAAALSWDLMHDLAHDIGPAVKVVDGQIALVHDTFRHYLEQKGGALVAPDFHAQIAEQCMWYIRLASEDSAARILAAPQQHLGGAGDAMVFLGYAELYWHDHVRLAGDSAAHLDATVAQFLNDSTLSEAGAEAGLGRAYSRSRSRSEFRSRPASSRPAGRPRSRSISRPATRPASSLRQTADDAERPATGNEAEKPSELENSESGRKPEAAEEVGAAEQDDASENENSIIGIRIERERSTGPASRQRAPSLGQPSEEEPGAATRFMLLKHWASDGRELHSWYSSALTDSLCMAIQLGLDRVVELMLRDIDLSIAADAALPPRLHEAFIMAANVGSLQLVERFLAAGALPAPELGLALCRAVRGGHMAIVERLLQDQQTLDDLRNETSVVRLSPLSFAIVAGHTAISKLLLDKGMTVLRRDEEGNTAVHVAVMLGDLEALRLLVDVRKHEFEQCLLIPNGRQMNPLQLACENGYTEVVDLIKAHAPRSLLDGRNGSRPPLQLCCEFGHAAVWDMLVQAGADPLAGDPLPLPGMEDGYFEATTLRSWQDENPTLLEAASRYGSYDIVTRCLATLKPPAPPAKIPQDKAKKKRRRLKENEGRAAGGTDNEGDTATERDASVDARAKADPDKASEADEQAAAKKERLKSILASGFLEAVGAGHPRLVQLLLKETERDPEVDFNAMRVAVGRGHLAVVKVLVSAGILSKMNVTYNPLPDLAISGNYADIVRCLTDNGVQSQWDSYETSIHFAARMGFVACLRFLLRAATDPADVKRPDCNECSALEVAARTCNRSTFEELFKWWKANDPDNARPRRALLHTIMGDCELEAKIEFIGFLVENGWELSSEQGSEMNPLHLAVAMKDDPMVHFLLNAGADPRVADQDGDSALHQAAMSNVPTIMEALLEKGAEFDQKNNDGLTALHAAAVRGCPAAFRTLLGLDLDGGSPERRLAWKRQAWAVAVGARSPTGMRAIHFAADTDSPEMLQSLFEAQGEADQPLDVDARDDMGRTALMHACDANNVASVELLLDNKADPNLRDNLGQTAMIHVALTNALAESHAEEMFRVLVRHKAEVDVLGGPQGSLLHTTLWKCYGVVSRITTLLELGATANVEVPPYGSPLHVLGLASYELRGAAALVATKLVESGARVEAKDGRGRTPLMLSASRSRTFDTIEACLGVKADPNTRDALGKTPLHYTVRSLAGLAATRALLEAGADALAVDLGGRSVLYMAGLVSDENMVEIFQTVVEHMRPEKRAAQKAAALTAAVKSGSTGIHNIIVREPGVDVNVPDHNGWTALDVAQSYVKWDDTVTELLRLGAVNGTNKKMPSRLSRCDRPDDLFVSEDGTEAGVLDVVADFYAEDFNGSVRSDHCISLDKGIYYFEVEILLLGHSSAVAVGLSGERLSNEELVGWGFVSWGYHSDDGGVLCKEQDIDRGPSYGAGDVIGVAYDAESHKAWFIKNGKELAAVTWKPVLEYEQRQNKAAASGGGPDGNGGDNDGDNASSKDGSEEEKEEESDNGEKEDADEKDGRGTGDDVREEEEIRLRTQVRGQLYPTISIQHNAASLSPTRVRVNFGPDWGAAATPFKYAPPAVVPPDSEIDVEPAVVEDDSA